MHHFRIGFFLHLCLIAPYDECSTSLKCLDIALINEVSQFYLPPIRLSTNRMNHSAFDEISTDIMRRAVPLR